MYMAVDIFSQTDATGFAGGTQRWI